MKKTIVFIALIIGLSLPMVYQTTPYQTLKLKTFDYLVPKQDPTGFFTILNITEEDVIAEGGYPFPRKRLAEIQKRLYGNGAIGVGWVIAFTEKDRFGGDADFAMSILADGAVGVVSGAIIAFAVAAISKLKASS